MDDSSFALLLLYVFLLVQFAWPDSRLQRWWNWFNADPRAPGFRRFNTESVLTIGGICVLAMFALGLFTWALD